MVTAADIFDSYQLNWRFQDWGRGIRDRRWLRISKSHFSTGDKI